MKIALYKTAVFENSNCIKGGEYSISLQKIQVWKIKHADRWQMKTITNLQEFNQIQEENILKHQSAIHVHIIYYYYWKISWTIMRMYWIYIERIEMIMN